VTFKVRTRFELEVEVCNKTSGLKITRKKKRLTRKKDSTQYNAVIVSEIGVTVSRSLVRNGSFRATRSGSTSEGLD